ncbi:MAG TPA: efflux RND transporter permease subunit [Gemmatimonadaceae bacterium]|nr:efflux RND transporter permease subunit [Gemmatimonadaceae bacterium]
MWLVKLALRQPYTVAVIAAVMILMGVLSMQSMLVDIFPAIDIPVVAVAWTFPGLSAQDMETRIVTLSERGLSSTVNGIERIESSSIPGMGLLRIYLQQGTDIGNAIAQIAASSSTSLRNMPRGVQPPTIIQSNASSVPVAQLTLSSATMPEEAIADYAQNFLRLRLFTVQGLSTPSPYGGKTREITVDVNPALLAQKGLSAQDVVSTVLASNVFIPAGTARLGTREYNIALNSSPSAVTEFAAIPIKVVNGAPVTIGDVAHVSDGFADQTNIVRVNGRRAAYLSILKKADASTLAVVEATRDLLPLIRTTAPEGLELNVDFDQSVFVRAAVKSVVTEGLTAALLVSLMILVFLGSWRSVLVACASIPLAISCAIIGLKATGNSFNIMTLGGLSLSIGLLVDVATITVENIHRNRSLGKPLTVSILDGAAQISLPVIMATLAICIVFFPIVLLEGPARFLFVPMAIAVVVAMLAAYLLSRSLVKTLARMLLAGEIAHGHGHDVAVPDGHRVSALSRFSFRFNAARDRVFGRFQDAYARLARVLVTHPGFTIGVSALLVIATGAVAPSVGTDFFPSTDAGLMKLHFRAPSGSRIEYTDQLVSQVEDHIRSLVPPAELGTVNSMIGVPGPTNMAYTPTDNASAMDAEILISLKPGHHPTGEYVRKIRADLAASFPGSTAYFQTADIVSQVLNFGLSAPIDIQVQYNNLRESYRIAALLRDRVATIPGAADVHVKQVLDYPTMRVDVDRQRASEMGLSQSDVANAMLVSLSSSALVSPSFYIDPSNGVNYLVAVKVPLNQFQNVRSVMSTPVTSPGQLNARDAGSLSDVPHAPTQTLGNLASIHDDVVPNEIDHYTVQRVVDVNANVEGSDLGSVISGVNKAIAGIGKLPPGMQIFVRGQGEVMNSTFKRLGLGLIIAILLVYLLMVVMFQSWLDPFIIMVAVPGALVGVLWMLAFTGTTINVVSLMGTIMAVGIGVSNAILLVSFANDIRLEQNLSPQDAAVEAGRVRLRPVLMTALAMILGMLPMAIGAGEGGEQNAPLGRAVIGGLMIATVVTLLVIPVVYAKLRRAIPTKHLLEQRFLAESQGREFDDRTMGEI